MKTKYRNSCENTYLGPIESMPDQLFVDKIESTRINTQCDGNNNKLLFSNLNYECWMKSTTTGEIRFYAGHHKHVFATCDRPIACEVVKGQIKVKCGSQKWTITQNSNIKLDQHSKYYVKNNSLRHECVVKFKFELY